MLSVIVVESWGPRRDIALATLLDALGSSLQLTNRFRAKYMYLGATKILQPGPGARRFKVELCVRLLRMH